MKAQPFKVPKFIGIFDESWKKSIYNELKADPMGYNLPLIIIETNNLTIVNEPKIAAKIKVIDNGPGKYNFPSDPGNVYDGLAGIELRGQSSQMFPKKSYGFETRDNLGANRNVSLLGMPAENDWVLYASYSDKTLLRNALTYFLGGRLGNWQPHFRFCEVFLNGSNVGVYQLTEKIKQDKNRVDIAKLNPDETSGDNLTGGYIFKVDKINGVPATDYFYSVPSVSFLNARNYAFTFVDPKPEDIVPEQKNYLAGTVLNFQNTLNSSSFNDKLNGYSKYLDINSFVDFEIINELANNVDGYRYSTYFYKQKNSDGGKIFAGPIWDFDLSYGNVNYSPRNLSVTEWVYPNFGPNEGYCMHWWFRLMQDPTYVNLVKSRWTQLRQGPLHKDSINSFIDKNVALLGNAVFRNFEKWPVLGSYIWPNYFIGPTHKSEIDYLKDWVSRRITWIDSQWIVQTGIDDSKVDKAFTLFPNPFRTSFTIKYFIPFQGDVNIGLYNIPGVCVYQELQKKLPSGYQELFINVGKLNPGIYILRINLPGDQVIIKKIVCKPLK
jgi:hypothetical protein